MFFNLLSLITSHRCWESWSREKGAAHGGGTHRASPGKCLKVLKEQVWCGRKRQKKDLGGEVEKKGKESGSWRGAVNAGGREEHIAREISSRWHSSGRSRQCGGQDSVSKGWRTWCSSTHGSGTIHNLPWAFIWPWACFLPQFFPGTAGWVGSTSGPGKLQVYHMPTLPTFGGSKRITSCRWAGIPRFSKSALQLHLILGYKLQPGWFPKG